MPVQSEIRLARLINSLKISPYVPALPLPVGGYSGPRLLDVGLHTHTTQRVQYVCVACVCVFVCVYSRTHDSVVCFCIH